MNPLDHQLNRLFKAAAATRRPAPARAPGALAGRTLAQWRTGTDMADDLFALLPIIRRALVLACVLALVALALSYRQWIQRPSDEVVIINSPITLTYLP